MSKFFSTEQVGPGCWYSIHLAAAKGKYIVLDELIKMYAQSFVCVECRLHIRKYIKNNPLPQNASNVELFKWTVDFHNAVNTRLRCRQDSAEMWRNHHQHVDEMTSLEIFNDLTEGSKSNEDAFNILGRCGGECKGEDNGGGDSTLFLFLE